MIRLALATEDETKRYYAATGSSGLVRHKDIQHLEKDPLAIREAKKRPLRTDHAHLSVADDNVPRLIQWYARHSNGYHYPYGDVMVVVNDPLAAFVAVEKISKEDV